MACVNLSISFGLIIIAHTAPKKMQLSLTMLTIMQWTGIITCSSFVSLFTLPCLRVTLKHSSHIEIGTTDCECACHRRKLFLFLIEVCTLLVFIMLSSLLLFSLLSPQHHRSVAHSSIYTLS